MSPVRVVVFTPYSRWIAAMSSSRGAAEYWRVPDAELKFPPVFVSLKYDITEY